MPTSFLQCGRCTNSKCNTLQLIKNRSCEVTCKILFKEENNAIKTLQACTEQINKLLPDVDERSVFTEEMLLHITKKVDVSHDDKYVMDVNICSS